MKTMQTQNTEYLLKTISDHLSGRKDCKGQIYRVALCVEDDKQLVTTIINKQSRDMTKRIVFTPDVKVFPNIHNRKPTDKINIIKHVLKEHYRYMIDGVDNNGNYLIFDGFVVPGIYEYQISMNGKRRRWVRLK